ncbi:MAG TPA: hypothetical protein VGG72_25815 [Bryobacteraceae bacterium]
MTEPLADKPAGQTVDEWLNHVKTTTVLNPLVSQEWISLDGMRALKAVNRNDDSTESEHLYVVKGSKTFAIRTGRNTPSYATYLRMLSTFRFTAP